MLELKKYKAKIIFDIKPYIFFVLLSIFTFAVSMVFVLTSFYHPVELQETSTHSKKIVDIEAFYGNKGALREIDIICADGSKFIIDSAVSTEPLKESLENLTGEDVTVFVNDKADCVIQINHNDNVILDAETSQTKMFIDGLIFVSLGILLFVFSLALFIYSLKKCFQLKREKKEYLKNN